ncbi:contactin-2-like [Etheostoma cragini]|uniref:contactin-2-like n=1 Tax=Etheostoma cragini TaxID=417921 RepID=UPI00155F06B6|nr:contactin-2-like [Etheostoma cragini]
MAPLELILIFLLQFEGIRGREYFLYKRPGEDAVLPCTTESSSPQTCSTVTWIYNKERVQAITEVMNGKVTESSSRAARLSVNTDCSLVINNVTAEDAGHYTCREGRDSNTDEVTYLSVLTISPSQPDADPNREDDITLECSLFSGSDIPCRENRIRWVDESGAELLGEGDGYRVLPQTTCVSFLTVKRQSGRYRKYTCQFVDEQNSVKIEADYTPDLTGIRGRGRHFLYKRPGQDVVLPCTTESSSPPTCSTVIWLYDKDGVKSITEVRNGEVRLSSSRAARLSVTTDCSLVINNVTAEDAGQYTCRQRGDINTDEVTYLSVLTISPSQPDADPNREDDITLECSLFSRSNIPCRENSIRWVDESGAELLGEGDGYRVLPQTTCVSFLTVKRQSGRYRKYTCQFVDEQNSVKIETDYPPDDPPSNQIYIIIGGVVGAVVVLVVIAVLIIYRKRANVAEDALKPTQHPDEPESNLTYVTVNHANQQASAGKKGKKEEMTYSTVKSQTTEAYEDPSNLYSNVRNLK